MAELDFTCPSRKDSVISYWNIFIGDLKERANVKPGHLVHLKILCELLVEMDELKYTIATEGRTYESIGRNGTQVKIHPAVDLLGRVITQIKDYSKMLRITVAPDNKDNEEVEDNDFK